MRCKLNDLGYQVTKVGKVSYRRKTHPFTLKRILSIYGRSFQTWYDESAFQERLDATGYFRRDPKIGTTREIIEGFDKFTRDISKTVRHLQEVYADYVQRGPDMKPFVGLKEAFKSFLSIL